MKKKKKKKNNKTSMKKQSFSSSTRVGGFLARITRNWRRDLTFLLFALGYAVFDVLATTWHAVWMMVSYDNELHECMTVPGKEGRTAFQCAEARGALMAGKIHFVRMRVANDARVCFGYQCGALIRAFSAEARWYTPWLTALLLGAPYLARFAYRTYREYTAPAAELGRLVRKQPVRSEPVTTLALVAENTPPDFESDSDSESEPEDVRVCVQEVD